MLAATMRENIRDFDSDLEMQSMSDVVSDSLWIKRLSATLIGLVAVLAIILAAAGILLGCALRSCNCFDSKHLRGTPHYGNR